MKQLLAESTAAQQPPDTPRETPTEILKRLERVKLPSSFHGKIRYIVAEDSGDVVGLCVFYTYSDGHQLFADVRDLYVRPDRRRRGLGTALLDEAKREAAREGCWLLIALPPPGSDHIVSLLEKSDFERGMHQPYTIVLENRE
jgi:GNAT superfamily N-acetyltransferase